MKHVQLFTRRASLATLHDPADGSALDRALLLWFPGPTTATGAAGASVVWAMAAVIIPGPEAIKAAASRVKVSLALTTAQDTGGAGTDTLTGIENLLGSRYNDTLIGGLGADILDGGAGTDTADYSASSAGIIDSPPSRPKRLVPTYFLPRNFSYCSPRTTAARIAFLPLGVKSIDLSPPSMRSCRNLRSSTSAM